MQGDGNESDPEKGESNLSEKTIHQKIYVNRPI